MSLVTYDLSDSDEEIDNVKTSQNDTTQIQNQIIPDSEEKVPPDNSDNNDLNLLTSMFNVLPKPKNITEDEIIEEDDIPPKKETDLVETKSMKQKKIVQITIPSLSEFKDIEEDKKEKRQIQSSQKTSSLFTLLPPPKSQTSKALIPQTVVKKMPESKLQNVKKKVDISVNKTNNQSTNKSSTLVGSNYDSESEDEEEMCKSATPTTKIDFFSLTSSTDDLPSTELIKIEKETEEMTAKYLLKRENIFNEMENLKSSNQQQNIEVNQPGPSSFSLHKDDIIMKNKVDVGPKLPVPEQDYNLDSKGNVAFDDKAIQYLCGKRGVKRRNEELESVNIIEINGEDIKPDEREWLVKALTEKPIHRPVSLGAGPGGQSKKKHQITYLAHQAKVMELELQNQWSQNRLTRQQTQSKYGF